MLKKGFFKIQLNSLQLLKGKAQACTVKIHAVDTVISAAVHSKQSHNQTQYLLPITDKIQIELHSGLETIGFFELPVKKIFDFPTKKHIISVNCITKDTKTNQVNPELFGTLKLSLMYFQNYIAKLDILLDKVQFSSLQQKEVFLQCVVGNVSSQTTLKKVSASLCQWKQILPFTLQSIPGKIQLILKEKEMINGQSLGKVTLDPHLQHIFLENNNKEERKYQINTQGNKIVIHLSKLFRIPENQ